MRLLIYDNPPAEFGEVALQEELPSVFEVKTPLIQRILTLLSERGMMTEDDEMKVRLCLDEVMVNAIKHGNRMDENKTWKTSVIVGEQKWAVRIEDQGAGFDPVDVPDINDPASLLLEGGRGILLITEFMDEIWYYKGGCCVQLTKNLNSDSGFLGKLKKLFGFGK